MSLKIDLNPASMVLKAIFGPVFDFIKAALGNKYFWIVLGLAIFVYTFWQAGTKFVDTIKLQVAHELEIKDLQKQVIRAENDKVFAQGQAQTAKNELKQFKEDMAKIEKNTNQSQKTIKEAVKTGKLQDAVLPSVSLATMDELDRLAAEITK